MYIFTLETNSICNRKVKTMIKVNSVSKCLNTRKNSVIHELN